MAFVALKYKNSDKAPEGSWVSSRASTIGPSKSKPALDQQGSPDFCGQCVSYVTRVCDSIPVGTSAWKKGGPVKGNAAIVEGTAIATFDNAGKYKGHAAIYVSQTDKGINVYDQWVTGVGKAIGPRLIRWDGVGVSNNGQGYYVIES
jgi:hypothetical protein